MSRAPQSKKIGLLVGSENTFPEPFLESVNRAGKADGISAEMVSLGGNGEVEEPAYAVIVDRISHEVPYYRAYLKSATLLGTVVINDPFWWQADEKFFECTLARKLGVAVPRTVALPNKDYIPDIDREKSLRNLKHPLDWERLVAYTGLPAVLKPNTGGGWKDVHFVHSIEELISAYDTTGQKTMILQEFIDWSHILPIRYNPKNEGLKRYVGRVDGALAEAATRDARTLTQALGYDMDTVEFAVRDGTLYAIDFLNPAPDFDSLSIKEDSFEWVLDQMTALVLGYARGQTKPPWRGEHRWWHYVK